MKRLIQRALSRIKAKNLEIGKLYKTKLDRIYIEKYGPSKWLNKDEIIMFIGMKDNTRLNFFSFLYKDKIIYLFLNKEDNDFVLF
jgi:hypothetical protein